MFRCCYNFSFILFTVIAVFCCCYNFLFYFIYCYCCVLLLLEFISVYFKKKIFIIIINCILLYVIAGKLFLFYFSICPILGNFLQGDKKFRDRLSPARAIHLVAHAP